MADVIGLARFHPVHPSVHLSGGGGSGGAVGTAATAAAAERRETEESHHAALLEVSDRLRHRDRQLQSAQARADALERELTVHRAVLASGDTRIAAAAAEGACTGRPIPTHRAAAEGGHDV